MTATSLDGGDLDDLLHPDVVADPYPSYHRQRAVDPVRWNQRWGGWVITGYAEARHVLLDRADFASEKVANHRREKPAADDPFTNYPAIGLIGKWVSFLDPPDHTRVRRALAGSFTVRAAEHLLPSIRQLAGDLADELETEQHIDFLNRFAFTFPISVITRVLGLPASEARSFKRWSDDLMLIVLGAGDTPDRHERAASGLNEMADYLRSEVRARQAGSGSADVLSKLVHAQAAGAQLTDDEIVAQGMILLFGGHETSTNLIANALIALDRRPDVTDQLRQRPDSMALAVEEFLRFDGPTKGVIRWVRRACRVGGHKFEVGQRAMVLIAAANRDPAHFASPDILDPFRSPNDHLAFGTGIHHCLGAALARAEAAVALSELLRRFDVVVDRDSLRWRPTMLSRSLESMSVVLRPR